MPKVIINTPVRDHIGYMHKIGELVKITSEPRNRSDFDKRQAINVLFLSNNEKGMLFTDEIQIIED